MRATVTPRVEQAQLELAQALLAAAVGVRDQRTHHDAARHGRFERLLELDAIEAEDDDVDRLPGLRDGLHERRDAVVGLDDQLHFDLTSSSRPTRPRAWPSGSSFRIRLETSSLWTSSGTWTS